MLLFRVPDSNSKHRSRTQAKRPRVTTSSTSRCDSSVSEHSRRFTSPNPAMQRSTTGSESWRRPPRSAASTQGTFSRVGLRRLSRFTSTSRQATTKPLQSSLAPSSPSQNALNPAEEHDSSSLTSAAAGSSSPCWARVRNTRRLCRANAGSSNAASNAASVGCVRDWPFSTMLMQHWISVTFTAPAAHASHAPTYSITACGSAWPLLTDWCSRVSTLGSCTSRCTMAASTPPVNCLPWGSAASQTGSTA